MAALIFENQSVTDLYNLVYSPSVANLKSTYGMRDALLPHIKAVINNSAAFEEACTKWSEFSIIKDHVKYQVPNYIKVDFDTSMCMSLWFYIYH